jgi:hypothetical protein
MHFLHRLAPFFSGLSFAFHKAQSGKRIGACVSCTKTDHDQASSQKIYEIRLLACLTVPD